MPRLAIGILLALAVTGALWALRDGGGTRDGEVLRGAPAIPRPALDEKVAFFFKLYTSGEQFDVGNERLPTWSRIGEPALKGLGVPALDYLMSEERFERYRAGPDPLANVFGLLTRMPEARRHERLYAFLNYWLVPENCPTPTKGSNWVLTFRKQIFAVFTHYPGEPAVAACLEELDRTEREHDLRAEAILVLCATGHAAEVGRRYEALPLEHRYYALDRVREMAGADALRLQAEGFRPLLRRAVQAPDALERINAASVLLRLGDDAMADTLLAEFEAAKDNESVAWAALRLLVAERKDDRVRAICEERLRGEPSGLGYDQARYLLARGWADEPDVQKVLWELVQARDELEPRTLRALMIADRPRVVAFLKEQILTGGPVRRDSAIRFARISNLREAGPWIIELVQRANDRTERYHYYSALTRLQTPAAVPLLHAELRDARDLSHKRQSATLLLAFHETESMKTMESMLDDGDEAILEVLYQRAKAMGRDGIPDALLPALLRALRHMPGEGSREKIAFAMRCRGTLEGAEEGLIEAYKQEPSRRVVNQIETALIELAHR